jgi:HPt (histidine-containing phosphotransfer) domain-containing protein
MMDAATAMLDAKPPLASVERPIDLVHLSRMTFGDRSLEREVLSLFDRQAGILVTRMETASPGAVPTLAHTLTGSARGIGAWRVARAAEALELACHANEEQFEAALKALRVAANEARTVIADLLRAH